MGKHGVFQCAKIIKKRVDFRLLQTSFELGAVLLHTVEF